MSDRSYILAIITKYTNVLTDRCQIARKMSTKNISSDPMSNIVLDYPRSSPRLALVLPTITINVN